NDLGKINKIHNELKALAFIKGNITEEDRRKVYEKHDFPYTPCKERRKGHFFMARTPDDHSLMLWKDEDGTVYGITGHPDVENIDKEPYKKDYTYCRAVSSFDF